MHRTVEGTHKLDMMELTRGGGLQAGHVLTLSWADDSSIRLLVYQRSVVLCYAYRFDDGEEWQQVREEVAIACTPCHFGGRRAWFLCPGCGHKRRILYLAGVRFRCRWCHRLVYHSQREDIEEREARKIRKIRRRLSGDEELWAPFPAKPRGMHWCTYSRLYQQEQAAVERRDRAWMGGAVRLLQRWGRWPPE